MVLCIPGPNLVILDWTGHDDVIKWKHFRVTGPLCGEFTGPGEFPTQRPVTRSFDVFFDLRLNKPLSKQSWGWWFETLSRSLWRHRNVMSYGADKPVIDTHNTPIHILTPTWKRWRRQYPKAKTNLELKATFIHYMSMLGLKMALF